MQKTAIKFEGEIRTLNIFYSFIMSIKLETEKDKSISSVFLNFEPKFYNINPDAALKIRKIQEKSYEVSFFEFKDAGRDENVIIVLSELRGNKDWNHKFFYPITGKSNGFGNQ